MTEQDMFDIIDTIEENLEMTPDANDEEAVEMIVQMLPRAATVGQFKSICEHFFSLGTKVRLFGDGSITIEYEPDSFPVPDEWTLAEVDAMMVKH